MPPGHQSAGCGLNTHHVTRQQLIALVAITLMWGVNWPMMKYSLRELSPLYFRAITMSGGALTLYAFYRWGRGVEDGSVTRTTAACSDQLLQQLGLLGREFLVGEDALGLELAQLLQSGHDLVGLDTG